MATVDAGKQATILHYLSVEGMAAGAITDLRADIVSYLTSNGHAVDMKKTPLKTNGATSRWLREQLPAQGDTITKARFYDGTNGLSDEQDVFDYGIQIQPCDTCPKMGAGTKLTSSGIKVPKRTIKADKYNYNNTMDANILSIASTGKPITAWMIAAENVMNGQPATKEFNLEDAKYSYTLGAGLGSSTTGTATPTPTATTTTTTTEDEVEVTEEGDDIDDLFDDDDDDTVEETVVEVTTKKDTPPPAPTPVGNAAKLKDSTTYKKGLFEKPAPITPDEEIALSGKEWEVVQETNEGYYPYAGRLLIDMTPAEGEAAWQPFASTIDSIADDEELDDLFDDDDFDDDDDDEVLTTIDESPWFTTPKVTFTFEEGMKAYFSIDGNTTEQWFAGAGKLAGKNSTNHFLVDSIEVKWAKPQAGVPDRVTGCRITGHNSSASADTHTIIIEDGVVQLSDAGNVNDGYQYNISHEFDDLQYNMYGGNIKPITNNSVLVYGHGVMGFKGLPDANTANAQEDTLVWSDLKSSSNGAYTGSVAVDADKSISQVIQTQLARFYGKDGLTDKSAYWNNWLPGGSGTMGAINGGGNVIMYFAPEVEVQADLRTYIDTEYLRPKRKKLDITAKEGEIPEATESTGVISFTPILDDDGDIEDEIWNAYVEFNVIPAAGNSTDYFTGRDTGSKHEANVEKIMLPGDESKMRFRVPPYGENDIVNQTVDGLARANSISYITYDKSTVEYLNVDDEGVPLPDSNLLVPQIKVFFDNNTSMVIPDEEGEFKALDFNGEELSGEVEGAELKPPQPKIVIKFGDNTVSYSQLETMRRNKNLSPKFTKRNKDGQVTTKDIAIKIGSKYYVVGSVNGKSVLMVVDLNME